jgi:hypothetical protein
MVFGVIDFPVSEVFWLQDNGTGNEIPSKENVSSQHWLTAIINIVLMSRGWFDINV